MKKKPKTKRSCLPVPIASSSVSSCFLWVEKHTWTLDQLREAVSQAGGAMDCDFPKSPVTGSESATCKLLEEEMAFKELSPVLEKERRRLGDHCVGFSVWVL